MILQISALHLTQLIYHTAWQTGEWVGLSSAVLNWFKSHLTIQDYFVLFGKWPKIKCGIPQGSILGSLLFKVYMPPKAQIMEYYNSSYHIYADDTQLYITSFIFSLLMQCLYFNVFELPCIWMVLYRNMPCLSNIYLSLYFFILTRI